MDNIVVLNDEHGNEVEFEYLDLIEHNNEAYVVLLPVDEEADEVVILRCEESDDDSDEENYRSVEDQDLLNEIFEICELPRLTLCLEVRASCFNHHCLAGNLTVLSVLHDVYKRYIRLIPSLYVLY